jgi:hypothetical protein
MSKRGIDFGLGVPWAALAQPAIAEFAANPDIHPLAVRVLFAALSRMDSSGHAGFGTGELGRILSSVDRQTGELRKASWSAVSDAIRQAKAAGYVMSDSTARCLVLSPRRFTKSFGQWGNCIHGKAVA